MHRLSPSATAAGAAAVALLVAGCGNGSSSAPTQSTKTQSKAPPTQTQTQTHTQPAKTKTQTQASQPSKKPETSPNGDIPDNQAYVAYSPPGGRYSVKVPEGWSRTSSGGAVIFTDKLNTIRMESKPASVATAVGRLRASVKGFRLIGVSRVSRKAGTAVRIVYLAAAMPNPVTGKGGTDKVERYVFRHNGKPVVLTLSGPQGADNVDPWRIVTNSVRWTA
jgi:hypothetical protein